MYRLLIILFISLSSIILYQILLSDNGILNGVQIRNENEKLRNYTDELNRLKKDNQVFIEDMKKNPEIYREFAEKLGFFQSEDVSLIRIRDRSNDDRFSDQKSVYSIENRITRILSAKTDTGKTDKKVDDLRVILTVAYLFFTGFFIVMVLISGNNKNSKNQDR